MSKPVSVYPVPSLQLREAIDWNQSELDTIQKDRVGFLHVPKVGGTSFYSFVCSFFSEDEIVPVETHPNRFEDVSKRTLDRYRLLTGNMLDPLLFQKDSGYHLLTMMRNPVDRLYSAFRYLNSGQSLVVDRLPLTDEARMKSANAKGLSFIEWLRVPETAPGANLHNRFTKRLNAPTYTNRILDRSQTESELQKAKKILRENFTFVGLTEQYKKSKELFCRSFGIPSAFALHEERLNKNLIRRRSSDITEEIVEIIERDHWADVELYRFAQDLFEDRWHRSSQVHRDVRAEDLEVDFTKPKDFIDTASMRGFGLYREEYREDGGSHRWTGGPASSEILFGARFSSSASLAVELQVPIVMDHSKLGEIEILLNGQKASQLQFMDNKEGVMCIRGRFDGSRISKKRLCHVLAVSCPSTLPPRNPEGFSDDRPLGIAIEKIQFFES